MSLTGRIQPSVPGARPGESFSTLLFGADFATFPHGGLSGRARRRPAAVELACCSAC